MVSTTEVLTDNSPLDVGKLVILKNPTERNLPSQFLILLDVTQKILYRD